MKLIQITDYGTHKHEDEFHLTDYFCPNCGIKNVWEGTGRDYYQGADFYCHACHHSFTMPGEPSKSTQKITWESR